MPAYCNSTNSNIQESTDFWSGGDFVWDAHRIGWVVCGASAVLTVFISLISILLHATHYQSPRLQRQTIRILLMPPVYAVVSFFSYRYFREYTYYSVSETSYEAITLSAFLLLMVGMVGAHHERVKREKGLEEGKLGGDGNSAYNQSPPTFGTDAKSPIRSPPPSSYATSTTAYADSKVGTSGKTASKSVEEREAERQAVLEVMRDKEKRKLPFPFNFWRFRPSKPYFMYSLKWSVLQYVILRPLLSIIAIICEYYNVLCPQEYSVHFAEVYLDAVDFVSISVALYGLIIFYMVTRSELQGRKPLAKFMAIKMIVFFTFYQTWLFGILQDHGVIKGTATWTATNVTDGLSALCTSIEMILFSLYMLWAYSYKEFTNPALQPQRPTGWGTFAWAFVDTFNLWDMFAEVGKSFRFFWRWMRRAPGTRAGEKDERTEFDQVFVPDHAPSAYAYDANHPAPNFNNQYSNAQGQDQYAYPPQTQPSYGYSSSPVPASNNDSSTFPVARPFPNLRSSGSHGSASSMSFSRQQRERGESGNSQTLREAIGGGHKGRGDSYSRLEGGGIERGSEDQGWQQGNGARDSARTAGTVDMPLAMPVAVTSPARQQQQQQQYQGYNPAATSSPTPPSPSGSPNPQYTHRNSWNPVIAPPSPTPVARSGAGAGAIGTGAGHYQRRRDVSGSGGTPF